MGKYMYLHTKDNTRLIVIFLKFLNGNKEIEKLRNFLIITYYFLNISIS